MTGPDRAMRSLRRTWRGRAIIASFALLGLVAALKAADVANPPDLSRYERLSSEVVDRHGTLLRPFLSKDGYWRLRTTVHDVNPRYLKLLEAYEDKRFASHWGVDPFAVVRAVFQFGHAGRIVSEIGRASCRERV